MDSDKEVKYAYVEGFLDALESNKAHDGIDEISETLKSEILFHARVIDVLEDIEYQRMKNLIKAW